MKKSFKMIAAVLAAITTMACASAVSYADINSDIAVLEESLSVDLSSLPVYRNISFPIKQEYNEFRQDFVYGFAVDGSLHHMIQESFSEKENNWSAFADCIAEVSESDIAVNSFEEILGLKPIGIWTSYDGTYPGLMYRISDDVLAVTGHGCKYNKKGDMTVTTENDSISFCVCYRLPPEKLYKSCWFTDKHDGKKYYIGKDSLPVTKNTTISGVRYSFDNNGQCGGKYTGWAKTSKGKFYYKNGVKVTKNTTINGVRYKFSSDGCCKGKFTGFVKSSKGRRYYKNGILLKGQTFTAKDGATYLADSFGYITEINDDMNPGEAASSVRDLMYNGSKYYLFISTEAFIYGDDSKCYVLDDLPDTVSKTGYKLKSKLTEAKELTELIKNKKSLGKLTYTSKDLKSDFEVTVKDFDNADLYENGKSLNDYGLTLVSSTPYCYVDGTAVYLYTTATKY